MAISAIQCFNLLLVFTASINTATPAALRKRSDDVNPQALMTLIQQQTVTIQRLEAKLTSAETELNSFKTSVAAELNSVKTNVESRASQQSNSITDLNTKLSEVNSSLSVGLNNFNARLNTAVLFTAHTTQQQVTVGSSSPIKFDAVVTNVGGGYNTTTGVFTAPVYGVYVVYAQLMKHDGGPTMSWFIDKSGTVLCTTTLEGNITYDKSSCLATTRMRKWEQVFVRRNSGSVQIEGLGWCSFSGFLLSRDP